MGSLIWKSKSSRFIRVLRLCGLLAGLTVASPQLARAAADDPVKMTTPKPGQVVLSNGLVTATIETAVAEISSIRYGDREMVNTGAGHNHIYFSRDGGTDYERLGHCAGSVVSQTPDGIDFLCRHVYDPASKDKHAWNVDVHFVVRRGVSGVYVYADAMHPANYPKIGVGEFRIVWSTPGGADELDTIYVDDTRHWPVPALADMFKAIPVVGGPKEITELTTGPWKGRYDCKYMYSVEYAKHGVWGFASDAKKAGAWVVVPNTESFNDGPNKQDLAAAVGTLLLHLNMNHYDGTGFTVAQGQTWSKFYGPYLLYVNDKPTADACWADAKARVKTEAAQWPYAWVEHADYPAAAQRGAVRGRLVIKDALKPDLKSDGAWIGLAGAEQGPKSDFQFQASAYQFWTQVQPGGAFTLPTVRPGHYTLYAFANGAVGQFSRADVQVPARGKIDLGDVIWNVPHAGKRIAWEIGTADRSAAEFGHGQDYFLPMMFAKLAAEVPEPLDYTVGRSDPAKDWFYAQTRHTDGNAFAPQHWRIHFTLDRAPVGDATLVLAFAGADRARLSVAVNDAAKTAVVPPVQGGNGLVREAVHTKYSTADVTIPAAQLHAGENTITLTQESTREAAAYVMYDYLRLELP